MSEVYAFARLVGVDPEDSNFWVAKYQNGVYTYIDTDKVAGRTAGDPVLIGQESGAVYSAPPTLRWEPIASITGTVRHVTSTKVLVLVAGVMRAFPQTSVKLEVGDVVEVDDDRGIIETVANEAEFSMVGEETDAKRYRRSRPSDESAQFVGAEVLRDVQRFVELPLVRSREFSEIGVRPAKGVLFSGPPGTGKTMVARFIAKRADAEFYVVNGPELTSRYVGDAELTLRNIFADAASRNRSIIFFDEIDSLAPARTSETHEASIRLVSMFLTLLDGFEANPNVMVIGATNRPEAIDPALLRGGRFQVDVRFGLPDVDARALILRSHASSMKVSQSLNFDEIAAATDGWSGADLADLLQRAGWSAAEEGRNQISNEDIAIALEDSAKHRLRRGQGASSEAFG